MERRYQGLLNDAKRCADSLHWWVMSAWQRAHLPLSRKNSSGMRPPCSVSAEEGKKRPFGASHGLAGHGCRGQAGVQHGSGIGQQWSKKPSRRNGNGQQERSEQYPPPGEQPREPGGAGEVEVEQGPGLGQGAEDEQSETADREQPPRDPEPAAQWIAPERRGDRLPAPQDELQSGDPEDRMQEDLGGVEEGRPPGRDQVAGVDEQERRDADQKPVREPHPFRNLRIRHRLRGAPGGRRG